MKKKRILSITLTVVCVVSMLVGCGNTSTTDSTESKKSSEHEAITMMSPFRNATPFIDMVKEQYPEINLEIIPYTGKNMTAYMIAQLEADDMPDIYTPTVYTPGQKDLSDRLIDLSGYSFTDNYAESRLNDVTDDGAIYLLPMYYGCYGITYNKTILEENNWELPTTFAELEELAPKVKEAGYNLAIDQIALPGYGFQYVCNILDTDFLNTINGRKWQLDYLNGTSNVKDSSEMQAAFSTLDKWKELGMLNGDGSWTDDSATKDIMAEGKTLFMLGATNTFQEGESDCEFGFMPYLSEDGTQNALILNTSRFVGLNKHLEDEGNEQKLEDAIHVMEVMSTVDGMQALNTGYEDTSLLSLKDYVIPDTNYYKENEQELNKGLTAPFIYAGWENMVVPIGNAALDYIRGDATLDELMNVFDESQSLAKDNSAKVYTTVAEKLDTEDCVKLVGICFGKASGADMSLISKNKWYPVYDDDNDLNGDGVSGSLFALPVTDDIITTILPTGWRGNINTVTLTGKRIKELVETGYDKEGYNYPYELVTPENMTVDDDTTYTVAICGVTDEVAKEGNLTDTGILGLTAAQAYFSQFENLSKEDLHWE